MALTDIADRLTPSTPLEITFASGLIATGRKFATLFGHTTQAGGTGTPYQVYTVVNVGDPVAAQTEVDALAGVGSQVGQMAKAFVRAALRVGNPSNFRVVLIPFTVSNFGPNQEGINAVKTLRSDLLVSCYPTSDSTNRATLIALQALISGNDRDLSGQFGSFCVFGSLDALSVQIAYAINSRGVLAAALPDSNTLSVPITGTLVSGNAAVTAVAQPALSPTGTTSSGSTTISAVSSVAGIYPGASITGGGIPANTVIQKIVGSSFVISNPASASNVGEALTITNLPTAGIFPGALVTGSNIPVGTTVLSVTANTLSLSLAATGAATGESITVQNQVSQPAEIVAAAHAGGQMALAFPYNAMQGIDTGLVPPQNSADWIAIDPAGGSESALTSGLSPMVVANGQVQFLRTRTTAVFQQDGITPLTAYFDWQDLVLLNDFRENVFLITRNPPFNNNPGGTKASLTVANLLKDEVLRKAQDFENAGAFQGVKSLAPLFQIAPSTTSRGRFDFKIPANVVPILAVIAGNIQAVTIFDFTL